MNVKGVRISRKEVWKLARYTVTPAKWWPVPEYCSGYSSLYIYYLSILATGQTTTARDLVKILSHVTRLWHSFLKLKCGDTRLCDV